MEEFKLSGFECTCDDRGAHTVRLASVGLAHICPNKISVIPIQLPFSSFMYVVTSHQ